MLTGLLEMLGGPEGILGAMGGSEGILGAGGSFLKKGKEFVGDVLEDIGEGKVESFSDFGKSLARSGARVLNPKDIHDLRPMMNGEDIRFGKAPPEPEEIEEIGEIEGSPPPPAPTTAIAKKKAFKSQVGTTKKSKQLFVPRSKLSYHPITGKKLTRAQQDVLDLKKARARKYKTVL